MLEAGKGQRGVISAARAELMTQSKGSASPILSRQMEAFMVALPSDLCDVQLPAMPQPVMPYAHMVADQQ